jgi:O-antigen ligase
MIAARVFGHRSARDGATILLVGLMGAILAALSVAHPMLTLVACTGCAVAFIALQSLPVALALFTVLTFVENLPALDQSVTLVKLATAALVLSWLALIAGRRWQPVLFRDHPLLSYGALLLAVWAVTSVLWARDPGTTVWGAFRLAQMLFLVFLVFSAVSERRDLRLFASAFIAGTVLTSALGLSGLAGGSSDGAASRFGGVFGNPNNLAAVVLPALALAAFQLVAARRFVERLLLAGSGVFLVLILFLTQSRGGLAGFAVMSIVAVAVAAPFRTRALMLVLAVLLSGLAYFTLVASPSERDRVTSLSAAGSTGRDDLWNVALQMTRDHPLAGVGMGNFTTVAPEYLQQNLDVRRSDLFLRANATEVHNTYLSVLAELGVVGLILFLAFLGAVLRVALRSARRLARGHDLEADLLARALIVGAAGMLAAYFFFSAEFEKQLWLILGSLVALSTLAGQARRPVANEPDGGEPAVLLSS